jgi:CubicO group peptidase (beta-lactamase class C family)
MGIMYYLKTLFSSKSRVKSIVGLKGLDYADAVFNNLVVEQKTPGISVTILKDGKPLLQKGYGYTDLDSKTPTHPKNSIFRIASISKCITGLAFGKMVEEGILGWDDSFYQHVPYYPKKKYDFTLRQLASHTAGIRGYRGKEFALNHLYSIKESIKIFKNDSLVFRPGKGYLYNSFDFVLLSLAMQEASAIPFEQYVKEKVLNPLRMNQTYTPMETMMSFRAEREIPSSKFYTKSAKGFKKAIEVDNFYKLAGGGYLSTSDDIAKMGQAILDGQLLQSKTYTQLVAPQMVKGQSTYYGLGFQVSQDAQGRSFIGHVGNSVGAYTNFFVYPEKKMVFSIMLNCANSRVQPELDQVIRATLQESFL